MRNIMRVIDLLAVASEHMKSKGFDNSRLEVERMLGNVLGLSRLELYLKFERPVAHGEREHFRSLYKRRLAHEPLQHLIGKTDFKEITVKTDRRAFIPRSETEVLAEVAVNFLKTCDSPRVADIGTGSGVIALSVAFEIPESRVVAVDISEESLILAQENACLLGLDDRVTFVSGNMLDGLEGFGLFDAVISNPPYIKSGCIKNLQPEVSDFDPKTALDGGHDGLRYLTIIIEGARRFLKSRGILLLECGDDQVFKVKKTIETTNYYEDIEIIKDLTGKNRIIKVFRREYPAESIR